MKELNNLKQIRLNMDLSLESVALLCGVNKSSIKRIEDGVMIPTQIMMLKISYGLKMNVCEIFNLDWRTIY